MISFIYLWYIAKQRFRAEDFQIPPSRYNNEAKPYRWASFKQSKMSKLFFLIFHIISISLSGQTIEIEKIENGTHVFSNDSIVIAVGHNYKPDGYGQTSIINAYDSTLKLKWTFTISSSHTNIIDRIKIFDKQIILTGLVGERDNRNLKTNRFITILNFDGKVTLTKTIGFSNYQCSNIVLNKEVISFCYNTSKTTLFEEMLDSSKNVIVEYNLKTKKIKTRKHLLARSWPKHLSMIDKNFYLIGIQHNKEFDGMQTFLSSFENKYKDILLPKGKLEEFYKVLINEQELTVVSYSNPYEAKEKRYLRFDKINVKTKISSTNLIPFTKLGWVNICTDPNIFIEFPSKENELWFYIYKSDTEASFVQLDKNGEKVYEIKSNILKYMNGIYFKVTKDFFSTEKFIYLLHNEEGSKLKLSRIKR
jgi:hypothetical protein